MKKLLSITVIAFFASISLPAYKAVQGVFDGIVPVDIMTWTCTVGGITYRQDFEPTAENVKKHDMRDKDKRPLGAYQCPNDPSVPLQLETDPTKMTRLNIQTKDIQVETQTLDANFNLQKTFLTQKGATQLEVDNLKTKYEYTQEKRDAILKRLGPSKVK